jgi:hypothetical protein
MTKTLTTVLALVAFMSPPALARKTDTRRPARIALDTLAPGSPFDCDTTRASTYFGSTARCLAELCRGWNVTNATIIGGDGHLRQNPCARRVDDRR